MEQKDLGKCSSGLQPNIAGLLCYAAGWITGLIFYLSGENGMTADFAQGEPSPSHLNDISIIPDGAHGQEEGPAEHYQHGDDSSYHLGFSPPRSKYFTSTITPTKLRRAYMIAMSTNISILL